MVKSTKIRFPPAPTSSNSKVRKFRHPISVKDRLQMTHDAMDTSDFLILCDDGEVPCHKTILGLASPFLKLLIEENPFTESFMFPDVSTENMRQAMSILYTGEVCSTCPDDLKVVKVILENLKVGTRPGNWMMDSFRIRVPTTVPEPDFTIPESSPPPPPPPNPTTPAPVASTSSSDSLKRRRRPSVEEDTEEIKIIEAADIKKEYDTDTRTIVKRHAALVQNPLKKKLKTLVSQPKVSILPKNPYPYFDPHHTADVINAMIQSNQLSIGPANPANRQFNQFYQQQQPTFVTPPGISTPANAFIAQNVGGGFMNPVQMPMMNMSYFQNQGPQQTVLGQNPMTYIQTSSGGLIQTHGQGGNFTPIQMPIQQFQTQQNPTTTLVQAGSMITIPRQRAMAMAPIPVEEVSEVYVIDENALVSDSEEGEQIQILGYNVENVNVAQENIEEAENPHQLSTEEINANKKASTQKDHAYAGGNKIRRRKADLKAATAAAAAAAAASAAAARATSSSEDENNE